MAFDAILFDYRGIRVITTFFIDKGLNIGMAFQTFFVGYLIAEIVTLGAIADTF